MVWIDNLTHSVHEPSRHPKLSLQHESSRLQGIECFACSSEPRLLPLPAGEKNFGVGRREFDKSRGRSGRPSRAGRQRSDSEDTPGRGGRRENALRTATPVDTPPCYMLHATCYMPDEGRRGTSEGRASFGKMSTLPDLIQSCEEICRRFIRRFTHLYVECLVLLQSKARRIFVLPTAPQPNKVAGKGKGRSSASESRKIQV